MCDPGSANPAEARAFCYLRFFTYREHRELRYLGNPKTGCYDKFSDRVSDLYELTRKSFARLWHDVRSETDPERIGLPFREYTGFNLQEIEEAFRLGDWYPFNQTQKNYGGAKHADIVMHTLRLAEAISAGRWEDRVPQQLEILQAIEHNRPRPARLDYESLLEDLTALGLPHAHECCLQASS